LPEISGAGRAGIAEAGVEGADKDVRDWNPESSTPLDGHTSPVNAFLSTYYPILFIQ